jgi:hypothetical protein
MSRGLLGWMRAVQALHNAPRVDDIPSHRQALNASLDGSFPTETIGIDSKERVFCQCGSRALQQETRPKAAASTGALKRTL